MYINIYHQSHARITRDPITRDPITRDPIIGPNLIFLPFSELGMLMQALIALFIAETSEPKTKHTHTF